MQCGDLESKVQHRYGKTCEFSKMGSTGTGMVVDFSTLWHTAYPYHGITGMPGYISIRVSLNFFVLKLVFSYFILVNSQCHM